MTDLLFDPPAPRTVPMAGQAALYPVHRIFCVGRNYAAHAAEMGAEIDREAPFYFTKSVAAVAQSGSTLPYPPGTTNYHHEMELVLALGATVFRADLRAAMAAILAYGGGLDMTRRDLQNTAKLKQRPWDLGKDVEQSAVLAPLVPADAVGEIGPQRIQLSVNGSMRQDARLRDMVWSPAEIVRDLSAYYHLGPGDLIMTGTPAGVGPVRAGDRLEGRIDGLVDLSVTFSDAET
ncbi:MAG: fumarylacetoacetate hydrolase family protein [Pseudomonadota bacterium]